MKIVELLHTVQEKRKATRLLPVWNFSQYSRINSALGRRTGSSYLSFERNKTRDIQIDIRHTYTERKRERQLLGCVMVIVIIRLLGILGLFGEILENGVAFQ